MTNNKNKIKDKKGEIEEIELLVSHIEKLSKYSYELEEKREQSLIEQSARMLEAFSVITAALGILLSIVLEYCNELSKYFIFIVTGIIGIFLIASLILAILAQWRYKYNALPLPEDIYKHVHDNYKVFLSIKNQAKHYNEVLNSVQKSKKKINDKRASMITLSMIFFYCAIFAFVISVIIAINILMF